MDVVERLYTAIIEQLSTKRLLFKPFPRLSYDEAMRRFGTDRPDLRFGLELADISDVVAKCDFRVFAETVAGGGIVKGFNAPGCGSYSRKQLDELTALVKTFGAQGLATLALEEGGQVRSSFGRFLSDDQTAEIIRRLDGKPGDLLLFVADQAAVANEALARLRNAMGDRLGLRDPQTLALCWVIDFPFVVWNADEQRWDCSHHPFTAPMDEDLPLLDTDPGRARGKQYDLVCNGYEIAGGSIRIHRRDVQEKVFNLVGLTLEEARQQFGHMLEAFEYGTPPHGGIAPGIDRFVMLLAGEPNIREVIAFPKTQNAADLMAGAPTPVSPAQLKELHIKLDL